MPRKREGRVYWRNGRAWGDFRDLGGGLEALRAAGEAYATKDADVAAKLATARVQELEKGRRGVQVAGLKEGAGLKAYASEHLVKKAEENTSSRHLVMLQSQLSAAVEYFGPERGLCSISTADVKIWLRVLEKSDNGRGGKLSSSTVRKYLNALSDLYARAVSDGEADRNPARELYGKPKARKVKARYWEPQEVALLLESARTLPTESVQHGRGSGGRVSADRYPWIYPLLATIAYAGLRKSEAFGLLVDDVSFKLGRIFVRPNQWRDLKNDGSERDVPLWPDLEAILRAYLLERERDAPLGALLFPSHRHQEERILDNVDRMLDRIGERCGILRPRLHAFRHSYTAARIQTLEHGAAVSLFQVARELGHASTAMIEKRYGHLARVKDRAEEVRFRPEDHREELSERLEALYHP